jgi:type II secretory pathway pseudopilin PulG
LISSKKLFNLPHKITHGQIKSNQIKSSLKKIKMSTIIKSPTQYTQDEVNMWLNAIGLGSMIDVFKENAIDGAILMSLTEQDLTGSLLQLTTFQARKFQMSLQYVTNLANASSSGEQQQQQLQQQRIHSLEVQNQQLQKENADLKAMLKALQEPNYDTRKNKKNPPTAPLQSTLSTTRYCTAATTTPQPYTTTTTPQPYTTTTTTYTPQTLTYDPYCTSPLPPPPTQGGTGTFGG